MILALLMLLAQVDATDQRDLCTTVKSLVRTSGEAFRSVRGKQHTDSAKTTSWTAPVRVPGASECKVIEYKDGSPPFYGCEMHATSCKLTEKKYLQLVKDVATCLDVQPKLDDAGSKRTARMHKDGVPLRVQFRKMDSCDLRFFVEPLK